MSLPNPLPLDENRVLLGLSINMWLSCGTATVIVRTRLITRIVLKKAAGWDDFFLFAIILYTGTAILLAHGYGRHIYYIEPSDLIIILKMNTMVNIAGFTSLALARTSVGLFLLRLTARVSSWEWVVYFGLALNTIQAVALIVLTGVHCVPIQKMWDPTSSGFCIPPKQFTAADRILGCLNVVVDFIFALFPLEIIRHFQIQRRIRVAVYLLLSCGLLTAVCSIGRVVASDLTVEDITWDLVPLTYWALSETFGVIILASLPAMRQFFRQTDTVKKVRTYFHSKVMGTKDLSKNSTMPERRTNDSDSRKDLVVSQGDIRMQKDVYVELSDREPDRDATSQYHRPGDNPYHSSAQATAEIV